MKYIVSSIKVFSYDKESMEKDFNEVYPDLSDYINIVINEKGIPFAYVSDKDVESVISRLMTSTGKNILCRSCTTKNYAPIQFVIYDDYME